MEDQEREKVMGQEKAAHGAVEPLVLLKMGVSQDAAMILQERSHLVKQQKKLGLLGVTAVKPKAVNWAAETEVVEKPRTGWEP